MTLPVPTLDHVVINARDDLPGAAARYARLGFALTPRGEHSFGTVNHLAMFGTDYLELLAAPAGRADLLPMGWPAGLNAIVFGTEDTAGLHAALLEAGVGVAEPRALSRPVETAGGVRDAKFDVMFLVDGTLPDGRAYFCRHFTRDLVWRDDQRRHPNGVVGVEAVIMATRTPAAIGEVFGRMFGPEALSGIEGGIRLACGLTRIEALAPSIAAERLGEPVLIPESGEAVMAGLVLRTSARARAGAALQTGGIAAREDSQGRLLVAAADAGGVSLVFAD